MDTEKDITMSAADDSDCEVQPILRSAINVNVGNINVIAILDDKSGFSAIHKTVFHRICEEEDDSKMYTGNMSIELDMSINNRSVTAVFRVLPDLWADMVLGVEFFISVKAHIHQNLRLLKWSYEDELVITEMVENDNNFRALSGGRCASNEAKSSEKENPEDAAPNEEPSTSSKIHETKTSKKEESKEPVDVAPEEKSSTSSKKKRNRKKTKKSKQNNGQNKDQNSDQNNDTSSTLKAIMSLPKLVSLRRNNTAAVVKKNPKKIEFVKVFIATRELWDIFSGKWLAYYGIYSPQLNISIVNGEVLEEQEKTPLGYQLGAFNIAMKEAYEHQVTHLHIISSNQKVIEVMSIQLKKYKDNGKMDVEPRGSASIRPFLYYYYACIGLIGYESLKLEYVPFTNERCEEMVRARKLVAAYIKNTPV